MKTKTLLLCLVVALLTITFNSCGSWNRKKVETDTTTSDTTKKVTAAYACPMHPEVTSDKPGVCKKCEMNLEKTEKIKKDTTVK